MPPELADLQGRYTDLQAYYSNLRLQWLEDEQYYDGSFDLRLPDKAERCIPGTGRNAVDVPATHIVTDHPGIHRYRDTHKGTRYEVDDEASEQFMVAVLMANDQAAQSPPLHEMAKFQFLRGEGIRYGPFLDLDKFEALEDDAIWFDCLDPMQVLLSPGPNPEEGFYYREVTIGQMAEIARRDKRLSGWTRNGRKTTERMILTEWYGWDWDGSGDETLYAAWEQGAPGGNIGTDNFIQPSSLGSWICQPEPSGYPYLPFNPVLSGYGIRSPLPEKLIQSIYTPQVKSLLRSQAYARSVADQYMGAAAMERYEAATAEILAALDIDYRPGSGSVVPAGAKRIEAASVPQALLQNYADVMNELEASLFSGIVSGQRPRGVDTASQTAILSGQARLKFGPPLRFLEVAVARLLYDVGLLIAHQRKLGEFSCMGRTIRAHQFHGDYRVKVELFSEAPEERNAMISQGLQMLASDKGPSEKYVYETFFKIENYEEEQEEKVYEKTVGEYLPQAIKQKLDQLLQAQAANLNAEGEPNQDDHSPFAMLQQMASLSRGMRPGESQMPALPGSVEAMAQQSGQVLGAGMPVPQPGGVPFQAGPPLRTWNPVQMPVGTGAPV